MELLVRGTSRAQRELVDAVAAEARVRVAVDEARNGREPAAVDLLEVAGRRVARRIARCPRQGGGEIAHRADRLDLPVAAEHERVVDHPHVAERGAAKRAAASRGRDLREIADQQAAHGTRTGDSV